MTDKPKTIDGFAPYPTSPAKATCDALAAHMSVCAHASTALNTEFFVAAQTADTATGPEVARYLQNQALMTAELGVAFLLHEIQEHLPEMADDIARRMWEQWEDAPLQAHTWAAVNSYEIDPEQVAEVALATWRAAQSELPLGDAS